MGIPRDPKPAKYFVGLLSSEVDLLNSVEADLTAIFGAIDARSQTLPWNLSTFYENEMGENLLRRFVAFSQLNSPENLAGIKLQTREVERHYRSGGPQGTGRRVNIDPGYLGGRQGGSCLDQKCRTSYLSPSPGSTARRLCFTMDGAFQACPHTYPDYLWIETLSFLTSVRSIYLEQLRKAG